MADGAQTTVTVAVGGCSVTIVAGEPASEVTKLALATLAEARQQDDGRLGPAAAGFTSQVDGQYNHDRQQGSMWRPVRAGGHTSTQVVTVDDFGFGAGTTP